jgi:hypothetical protein
LPDNPFDPALTGVLEADPNLAREYREAMATQLGRTAESVQARASSLDLSVRMREGFTAADLARCFGVSEYRAGQWLAAGLLGRVARDGNVRATEVNVRRFLREHPQKYDLRRVDQVWFLSMVFGNVGNPCRK